MNGKTKLSVEVYTENIGPNRAEELLKTATNPRGKSSGRTISSYARMMQAGRWRVGAPIMLDEKGTLLDGFTRLAAVVELDKPVEFLVLEGLPRSVADSLDDGHRRAKKAVLEAVCGVREYADLMSGIIVGIVTMPYQPVVVRNADMECLYGLYRPSVDWAVSLFASHAQGHVKRPIIYAFARAHLAQVNVKALSRIAQEYIDQTWDADSPMRLLSLYLSRNSRTTANRGGSGDLYLRAAKAIHATLVGEKLGVLRPGDDPFPCDSPF